MANFKVGDEVKWEISGGHWFHARINRVPKPGDTYYRGTLTDIGGGSIYSSDQVNRFDMIHMREEHMTHLVPNEGACSPGAFLDMLGNSVREGDTVAYSTTRGMRIAEVDKVRWHEKMDGGYHEITLTPVIPELRSTTNIYPSEMIKVYP